MRAHDGAAGSREPSAAGGTADRSVGPGSRRTSSPRGGFALLAAVALVLAGCGDSGSTGEPTGQANTVDPELHERLPDDVAERGVLRIVTDASYPPLESFADDGQTVVGVDPDIAAALGVILGVDIVFRNEGFGGLIDLVKTGEADLVMSAMTDTAEREADIDFIDYFSAGTSIVVQRGNPGSITDLASLCGHPVAVEEGTTQQALIERYQPHCADPIIAQTAATNDDALVLLRTGRAVAVLLDYPPAEWLTTDPKTHAHYEMSTTVQYEPGLYGIGCAKDRTELRDVVRDALAILLENGTYQQILDRWNVGHGAIATVSINAASGS